MTPHYHINLFWSDADGCWIADVPDLKHCSAHGASPEDATREIGIAITAWLETACAHGDPIPEAKYRPAIYSLRSAA